MHGSDEVNEPVPAPPAANVIARSNIGVDPAHAASATGVAAATLEYSSQSAGVMTRYRWVICALLFFATTINYLDRMVLGILAPTLEKEIGWSESDYGWINFSFTAAYAIGLATMGRFMDTFGARRGFSVSISLWSLAAMAHALARSAMGFGIARFGLALGEGGNFPGAVKTVAEWFPKKERALATGIFNAGANVGAILAPLTVPLIATYMHWQWAFIFTGAIGFVWLVAWMTMYRAPEDHPRVSSAELAYIRSDPVEPPIKVPYRTLLPHRQTWAFAIGKFMTDPVWWVIAIFWAAKYLADTYGLKLSGLALPLVIIYLAADVGSIGGGWMSSWLLERGWTPNAARKTTMLACALCVVPLVIIPSIHNVWLAVGLLSLTAAAHQGWSANLFTLVSDTFPRRAVGSVVGFGGMWGAIGGMLATVSTGYILEWTDSYNAIMYGAAFMYLLTLLIIHLVNPRLDPASLNLGSGGDAFVADGGGA